ncbi:hypothetical protein [Paenibacillus sp. Soil724D2]|uniref:hypothetical protein n=1 Tax=Paenibacillus sp. (strain Soil724D2) TaxID=1736392 RepID=UPI0007143188|nr:hypothetical protein [Paenibacillus sp. Soil724D2]KRE32897.1 hypothetical protein ASG85_15410 [Paenibacillus sp. Soil724D2]
MKRMLLIVLIMSCASTYIPFPVYGEHYKLSSLEITILFVVYAAILLPTLLIVAARGSYWGLKRVLRISIWQVIAYGAFTGVASAYGIKGDARENLINKSSEQCGK